MERTELKNGVIVQFIDKTEPFEYLSIAKIQGAWRSAKNRIDSYPTSITDGMVDRRVAHPVRMRGGIVEMAFYFDPEEKTLFVRMPYIPHVRQEEAYQYFKMCELEDDNRKLRRGISSTKVTIEKQLPALTSGSAKVRRNARRALKKAMGR